MATVTKHGAKRIKERLGLPKKAVEKNAAMALEHGLSHSECKGDLKRYIDGLYFQHGSGSKYRIYNHHIYCFTFNTNKLITTMDLPPKLHKLADKLQKRKDEQTNDE